MLVSTDGSHWDSVAAPGTGSVRDLVANNGGFLLLGKVGDDKVVVQSPKTPRPELMTREALEAVWDGRLVLMTRRAGLTDLARRFDAATVAGEKSKCRASSLTSSG